MYKVEEINNLEKYKPRESYPFRDMQVGQGFFVPGGKTSGSDGRAYRAAWSFMSRNSGIKFRCRTGESNGESGLWIVRTE